MTDMFSFGDRIREIMAESSENKKKQPEEISNSQLPPEENPDPSINSELPLCEVALFGLCKESPDSLDDKIRKEEL